METLTAISLHGGLAESWPRAKITAKAVAFGGIVRKASVQMLWDIGRSNACPAARQRLTELVFCIRIDPW